MTTLATTFRLIFVTLLLASFVGGSAAAPRPLPEIGVFVQHAPVVAQRATVSAFPDALDIPLPFTVLDSDEPGPVWYAGALWFTAYRVDSGADLNGGWVLKWTEGAAVAIQQTSKEIEAQTSAVSPVGRYSPARGGLFVGADGRLYHASFPSTNGRARVLQIRVVQ